MPRLVTDAGRRRIWFISPALATVIFFTAQILISLIGGPSGTGVAGLAPQTPQAPRGDRVVQTIEPVDPVERTVPRGTDELLELLDQHRAIRFRPASARTTPAGAGALGGLGAAHP
jgi:hypothetical protein